MDIWTKLYDAARGVWGNRTISPFIEAGGVAAALVTKAGNIYTGVCIDTACSLGMCAERSAIASMITHGEQDIDKLLVIMSDGSLGTPCGACRELMMQLSPRRSGDIEILRDLSTGETLRLGDLLPAWWDPDRV